MKYSEIINETQINFKKIITPEVKTIDKILKAKGYSIRVVGGAVRDLLSGKIPKDIDLASDATPQEIINAMTEKNIRVIPTGLQHGTVTVVINNEQIEITTLRVDVETDGRHAKVEFTRNWRKDAERRDLTFNAMSMDMDGNIYDYFNGEDDLNNGLAKFVGNPSQRIKEDYLRILRYFRFASRQSTIIWDRETLLQIKENVGGLKQISGERVWAELKKILESDQYENVVEKMILCGVMDAIGIILPRGFIIPSIKSKNSLVRMSLFDQDPFYIKNLLKLSNDEYNTIDFIFKNKNTKLNINSLKNLVMIPYADITVLEKRKVLVKLVCDFKNQDQMGKVIQGWTIPKFPINSKHVIDKGFSGKLIREKTIYLYNIWVESNFSLSIEELLEKI